MVTEMDRAYLEVNGQVERARVAIKSDGFRAVGLFFRIYSFLYSSSSIYHVWQSCGPFKEPTHAWCVCDGQSLSFHIHIALSAYDYIGPIPMLSSIRTWLIRIISNLKRLISQHFKTATTGVATKNMRNELNRLVNTIQDPQEKKA